MKSFVHEPEPFLNFFFITAGKCNGCCSIALSRGESGSGSRRGRSCQLLSLSLTGFHPPERKQSETSTWQIFSQISQFPPKSSVSAFLSKTAPRLGPYWNREDERANNKQSDSGSTPLPNSLSAGLDVANSN